MKRVEACNGCGRGRATHHHRVKVSGSSWGRDGWSWVGEGLNRVGIMCWQVGVCRRGLGVRMAIDGDMNFNRD